MTSIEKKFLSRANKIPFHGTGLSVDLHVPDLYDLAEALSEAGLSYDYLEIFKAPLSQLFPARERFPQTLPLEYHADGLWFTQPDFLGSPWEEECRRIARHTRVLRSSWITHECASKQISGRSVGTYLPPLLTLEAARLAGNQGELVQRKLDELSGNSAPLLLIEVPPFYTFTAGDISLEAFFQEISKRTSCGILLDIGHLYSYYLSSDLAKTISPADFLSRFLDRFPLHSVIQIHLGGLRPFHETFLDDHGSPVPPILFDLLRQTLRHPGLVNLKGIALEVDTKEISLIVGEYEYFLAICRGIRRGSGKALRNQIEIGEKQQETARGNAGTLEGLSLDYFNAVPGCLPETENPVFRMLQFSPATGSLIPFQRDYLVDQVLNWSGRIEELFPATVQILSEYGVRLESFIPWFLGGQSAGGRSFDFFIIKLDRFREFALEKSRTLKGAKAEGLAHEAEREYREIMEAYFQFNPED